MSDIDVTQARQDVVANVDEIIEHVINANMLSMPYHVYSELFDAVDGLGVEIENLQAENAKLRESLERAAGIIADICGECPVSRYEWLSSDGCAEKCGSNTEDECWVAYLTGKRWDESGAEVDG